MRGCPRRPLVDKVRLPRKIDGLLEEMDAKVLIPFKLHLCSLEFAAGGPSTSSASGSATTPKNGPSPLRTPRQQNSVASGSRRAPPTRNSQHTPGGFQTVPGLLSCVTPSYSTWCHIVSSASRGATPIFTQATPASRARRSTGNAGNIGLASPPPPEVYTPRQNLPSEGEDNEFPDSVFGNETIGRWISPSKIEKERKKRGASLLSRPSFYFN